MRSFLPVSIRHLALVFIVGLLALTGLVGAIASYQTRSVAHSMSQHAHDVARTELTAATERLVGQMTARAQALAEWDETRQQLVMPEYYTHWRDHRVYENRMLNGPGSRVALYAADGRILAPTVAGPVMPAVFPASWPTDRSVARLVRNGDATVLYVAFPLFSDAHRHALLGHGILRVDFMAALLEQNALHFVDRDSIRLRMADNEEIDTSALPTRLTYAPLPNADQERFLSILSRTLIALLGVLGVAALLGLVVYNRLLVRPLRRLSQDIDAMQQGQFRTDGGRTQPMHVVELENVRRSLYDYQLQLRKLHGSLEHQNREFHSQARQDALTGCYNRRAYEEDWEALREDMKSVPQSVAFLLFDCDRFKAINDTYGHAKGDRVLTLMADALVMALRARDRLYRFGGDEFATFLVGATPAQARQIAQRCQNLLDASAFTDLGINEPVGISIGIAFCPANEAAQVDDLPKRADIAMYTAKKPGHDRIAVYGEDTDAASQTLVASRETSALFQALATPGMIELHYQPIHALPARQIEYYEALARIRYNDALIMPGAFMPVIGSRRLETPFDLAVLQQVDADLASGQMPAGCGVSINLSAQSICKPEIVSQLLELSRHNDSHPLMLEITETSLITQMGDVRTYLELLRTVKYRIAMDDFGTGYSPLRYLVDLPVDVVKFDISLVNKLGRDDRAGRIVADFASMMGNVGYSLVAEGVETEAVLQKIEHLGIAHAQGFLLGRPMPLAALAGGVAGAARRA